MVSISFLTDEDFNNNVLRGLLRREPELEIWRVQDVGLQEADDRAILDWIAEHGHILMTHDRSTMHQFYYEQVSSGQEMPAIISVRQKASVGHAVEDILILIGCAAEEQWKNQIHYIPL